MHGINVEQLEKSFAELAPRIAELAERFYGRLFTENPALRVYFPASGAVRRHRLLQSLMQVVATLQQSRPARSALDALEAGAPLPPPPEHREILRETLIDAMEEIAAQPWTLEQTRSWRAALRGEKG